MPFFIQKNRVQLTLPDKLQSFQYVTGSAKTEHKAIPSGIPVSGPG